MRRILDRSSLSDVVSKVERNHELFAITSRLSNLSLNDGGSSSSGYTKASSSGYTKASSIGFTKTSSSGLSNPSLISTMTPTSTLLERFIANTKPSAFTENVMKLTKVPFLDVKKPLMNLTDNASASIMSLAFRFMPGQSDFLVREVKVPETLDGLRNLRDSLGLTLTKGTLNGSALLKLKGVSESVRNAIPDLASRILIEAITYGSGYYGRFLVLVQLGVGCTIWYGFIPANGDLLPSEGLLPLFGPIENYELFVTNPDVHVQPGFNKMTLVEGVDNVADPLSHAFKDDGPLFELKIPQTNRSMLVGISLGVAVIVLFTFGINPSCGEGIIS